MTAPDIGRITAARQVAAGEQLAAAKKKITTLERDRRRLLVGPDAIEAVLALDQQIDEQRRTVAALGARIAALSHPLSQAEQEAFGIDAVRHPITGMLLEQGHGALSPNKQARLLHLPIIETKEGPEAAAAILAKLDARAAA